MNRALLSLLALPFLAPLAGCEEHDHGHDHADESVAEELCEHMANGPAISVTAADPEGSDTPPSISDEHTRYDITLLPAEGGNIGAVRYAAAVAAHHAVALSADVPLQVFDAQGNEVALHHRNGQSALCDEVAADAGYSLEIGTATIVIGPTDDTVVSVVIELDADSQTHQH